MKDKWVSDCCSTSSEHFFLTISCQEHFSFWGDDNDDVCFMLALEQ